MAYLLGYDLGSSFIKASVVDSTTGRVVASRQLPEKEMGISAPYPGWAEQDPEQWYKTVVALTRLLRQDIQGGLEAVKAIGISYQMHGLVVVDQNQRVVRPAIIWCDGRAVETGNQLAEKLGKQYCLQTLGNLPGNFTASKLGWIKQHEPQNFEKVWKMMLPGDYLAMKMSGVCSTTPCGLSEGIMWDYTRNTASSLILECLGISADLLPQIHPNMGVHQVLSRDAAHELGIAAGTPISYRAGDQPNNALSLNVVEPEELAVTAGTSAVIYKVSATLQNDPLSRVNNFLHVNHTAEDPRYGVLLCVNGAGICNSWFRSHFAATPDGRRYTYEQLNEISAQVEPGAQGVRVLPYGNGAERSLQNSAPGASIHHLDFNRHSVAHIARAVQESVVFAMVYGLQSMPGANDQAQRFRAGNANMFKSALFRSVFATVTGSALELYDSDGACGAALGAGVGAGVYSSVKQALGTRAPTCTVEPDQNNTQRYQDIFRDWKQLLGKIKIADEQ